ncbi:MAG TPA: peptidoglycan -binding protein [Stellaceae bacterium]|nr:peptidoglycan -binding protein [Stellaceae bacterium]
MALSRRQRSNPFNIWPGFVDALAQLLMVIIFVLLIFTVGQFYLSGIVSDRDATLKKVTQQLNDLSDLLALEKQANADLRLNTSQLSSQLQSATAARDALTTRVAELAAKADEATAQASRADRDKVDALTSIQADREKVDMQLKDLESLRRDVDTLRQVKDQLEAQIGQLAAANDQAGKDLTAARDRSKELEARLSTAEERTALAQKTIDEKDIRIGDSDQRISVLNQNIQALRDQLTALAAALDLSEKTSKDQQVKLADLGQRLNAALANKVEELARYRSEFFGRLRQILGDRPDIRVVGDRFVFQSEVLFDQSSAELSDEAKARLKPLATAIKELIGKIPPDLNWILRIDGHTDRRPINTAGFPSNWELSTARAISVVKYLVEQGIPADRLAATGFGEFQPLDKGSDEAAFRRNRRIEIKLTER